MEFAYPCQRAIPYIDGVLDTPGELEGTYTTRPWPTVPPTRVDKRFRHPSRIFAQGGAYGGVTEQSIPLFPAQGGISGSQLDTMGERIQDFKELALRMCFVDYRGANLSGGDFHWWRIAPFSHSWGWLYLMRHMFAYMHGTLRYQNWVNLYARQTTTNNVYPCKANSKKIISLTWANGTTSFAAVLNTPSLVTTEDGVDEIAVPWYCPTHFVPTNAGSSPPSVWPSVDTVYPTWSVGSGSYLTEDIRLHIETSAGDDFSFVLPIAPPEIAVIVSDSDYEVTPPPMNYFVFT